MSDPCLVEPPRRDLLNEHSGFPGRVQLNDLKGPVVGL